MINFRTLKKDFSSTMLKDGHKLYKEGMVQSVEMLGFDQESLEFKSSVQGNFENFYTCRVEIDRQSSSILDSDCNCPYSCDCQHLAAILFHLEEHLNGMLLDYSKKKEKGAADPLCHFEKESLKKAVEEAEQHEVIRKEKKQEKELLEEYVSAAKVLGECPLFMPEEKKSQDKAELIVYFTPPQVEIFQPGNTQEVSLGLKVPYRAKPLPIQGAKEFIEAVRYHEPIYVGSKQSFYSLSSFSAESAQILKMIMDFGRFGREESEEERPKIFLESAAFGAILAHAYELASSQPNPFSGCSDQRLSPPLPCFYYGPEEEPLRYSNQGAALKFDLQYLETPSPKLFLKPTLKLGEELSVNLEEACLLECSKPGMLHKQVYYRFQPKIKRKHLKHLHALRDITIPEPLFGTFVENSLPELLRLAEVSNRRAIEKFVTLPFVDELKALCEIEYLEGELEAKLYFIYGEIRVPAVSSELTLEEISPFITEEGVVARNLAEEQKVLLDLFQGFQFIEKEGVFAAKNDKKIVEFMTDSIPKYQSKITFNCPQNLLDQFIYDDSSFEVKLSESKEIDSYTVDLKVKGYLKGLTLDLLWDCLASKRSYIELNKKKKGRKKSGADPSSSFQKILVLDLARLAPIVQLFDELGIHKLSDHSEQRPLWSLAGIDPSRFDKMPVKFSISKRLLAIQEQMIGSRSVELGPIPKDLSFELRDYQIAGIHWLNRLRSMHLNGILADDMGLGKTVQAIVAISQFQACHPDTPSLVICPTSLIYNWFEEFGKFQSKLKVLAIDGNPSQRQKLLAKKAGYHVLITSYSLLQKDIEHYETVQFGYAVLDEAQHIKNRGTRNAKSVKKIQAHHKLILTGTPIENSLDELWSLFDFLMPGLLSSFDRFSDKYVRKISFEDSSPMETLHRKVAPFILRRMKKDVLSELPPFSEIVYHCHLSELQRNLYRSYANTARKELSELVAKEGFERVQIQVLATLTRLKQICCHPAIFAKEKPEQGDSAKYDMLLELLQTLIEGNHKTVVFSQYTTMLRIIRDDLRQLGINFCYLDGSSKNRLSIVKKFNEDPSILVFLVSLKAGGTGLNLTSADKVVLYDPWWNPAVEDQAKDRVYRMGQTASVSAYKLITLGTIEEKILQMQERKKGLAQQLIGSDDEAISKLTWAEVLELLQT